MWRYDYNQFREFNPIIPIWTKHRSNSEKLYLLKREKENNINKEKDILAIYIWLMHLPTSSRLYLFYRKLLQEKTIREIFFSCRQMTSTMHLHFGDKRKVMADVSVSMAAWWLCLKVSPLNVENHV